MLRQLPVLFLISALFPVGCSSLESDTGGAFDAPCPGCDNVREIVTEFNSNPRRAKQIYEGERMRLGGRIESFSRRGSNIRLESGIWLTIGPSFDSPSSWQPTNGERAAWHNWMLSLSTGNVIEAECLIYRLTTPEETPGVEVPGTPYVRECKRTEGD